MDIHNINKQAAMPDLCYKQSPDWTDKAFKESEN